MPETMQTGTSAVIDFLGGFGKGMVQADINKREKEKHDLQKQRWQQEMTAFAAQDEFRRLQNENSRLEIDMRKTQFADIQATKEQTKGFVGFMADAIGKAKGTPAERQSQLFEAYTVGSAQFTMADKSFGDQLIDTYTKIYEAKKTKAWKIEDIKDYKTGKKRRAVLDEATGAIINYIPGEENLEIVNDKITQGIDMHQKEFDTRMQAFLRGQTAVLGAEGQSLDIESFMKSIEGLDKRTKSEVTMDWIFDITDRLWEDIERETGPLDVRLNDMLRPVVHDKKSREALVKPYRDRSKDYTAGIDAIIGKHDVADRAEILAAMEAEFEELLPEYEMPAIRMELARLQNKASLEIRDSENMQKGQTSDKVDSMNTIIEKDKKQKEIDLLGKFAGGIEGLQFGPKVTGSDWWANFLGMGSDEQSANEDEESEAYETLNAMQEPLVKSFNIGR